MLLGERDDLRLVEVGVRPDRQVGAADLAEPVVGHADDRGLGDTVEPREGLLDLRGVDVEPAADVHVFEPVGDLEVAALVEGPDVAGVQPPVGVDRRGGGLRVVEVADHHHVSARQHLTVVGERDLHTRERTSAGVGNRRIVVVGGARRDEAARLGQAVGGDDGVDAQVVLQAFDEDDGHDRGTGDDDPQAGEVVVGPLRVVEDGLEDGGRAREDRRALVGHELHRLVR